MATAQILAEYEQERLDVIAELKENGFVSGFGSKTGGVANRSDGSYSELCQEWYFPTESETFKDIIEQGESVYMVSNDSNLLEDCEFMGSEKRALRKIKPFPEGIEKPIFYEVLVRG